jgi:hypothetical protein
MIFASTYNNKDLQNEKSLTHKNSSESLAQSVPEPESSDKFNGRAGEVMRRVPSNSSYINKISHSGLNVKQALINSSETAA